MVGGGSSDAGRRGDGVAISFAVLGPLQIVGGEGPIAISGLKERRLLLALLLEPSAVVPTDRLVDALWGDAPPLTAERTLQAYVARLRRTLERRGDHGAVGRLLVGHGHGYAVVVEDSQLDALQFERLARQGRRSLEAGEVEPARARLGEALGLWRGLPYVELGDHHGAVVERQRLEAVRLTVVEDRLAADLAAGRELEVIPELERAVVEQPFRERLWGQLMVALYRAGRQADALRAFRRARDVLVEELGIEPGPELRHLEAAILVHDADLLVPVTSADEAGDRRPVKSGSAGALPAALESAGSAFVGREAEITRLRDLWGKAVAGEGQFISIVGSEGIGKTRLAAELAEGVHRDGSLVTYARCDHADRDPRRLFTQLVGSLDVDVGGESTSELGEVVARRLGAWSQHQPVLVVVDDLHAASSETLDALADVATWCSGLAILVLALFRADVDPLAVPAGPASVVLTGLDRTATQSICTLYSTAWDVAELDAIHADTQGVPLRVHEEASHRARRRMQEGLDDAAGLLAATRRTVARAESRVAEGVEGLQRLLERRRVELRPGTTRSVTSPYKGLARFEAADTAVFFGRERLVAELAARATGASLIAVVGPSGSGKSSVVRAGLLPALDAGLVPGRPQAASVTLVPGAHPAAALARAWPAGDERGALFVDQFEECFTTCPDEAERQAFLDRVVSLAGMPGVLVIIAVRADQFAVAATHPELAVLMARATVLVGPLRDDELTRVIELPARHAGAELEPGLLDLVMRDARGRRGVLPLLSTALLEAWVRREAGLMTIAGYQAGGGVRGAVATLAEGVFARLDAAQQEAAKRIFLRLAAPTEAGPADLGRRLPAADLGPSDDDVARHALRELIAGRLLIADGGTVELAHEALLWEWPRLRHWLDDDVEGQRLHAHLGAAARDWSEQGLDAGALYRGVRLNAATEWADRHADRLNDLERAFLAASVASAHRERDADRDRLMTARRTNRRLRLLLCAVAVMLAAAVTAGALAVVANRRADEQADEAVEQREAAELGRLVALSRDQRSSARDVAMLLAVEANRRADTPATRSAIQAALIAEPRFGGYLHDSPGVNKLAFNPSGTLIAIGGTRSAVQLWDARTRRRIGPPIPTDVPTVALWFTSDDELVVAGEDGVVRTVRDGVLDDEPVVDAGEKLLHAAPGPDRTLITLAADGGATFWDLTSGRPTGPRFPTETGSYGEVAVNVDGTIVATAVSTGGGGDIVLWDRDSGTMLGGPLAPLGVGIRGTPTVEFSPDGRLLATSNEQSTETIWDVASRTPLFQLDGGGHRDLIRNAAFNHDGTRLATTGQDGIAVLWDTSTGRPVGEAMDGQAGNSLAVTFSPDGTQLLTSGTDGSAVLWDLAGPGPLARRLGHGPTTDVTATMQRGLIAASGDLGVAIRDPATGRIVTGPFAPDGAHGRVTASADGHELVVATENGTIRRYDVNTGAAVGRPLEGHRLNVIALAYSADGRWLASGGFDENVLVHDLRTGRPTAAPWSDGSVIMSVAFTPDGRALAVATFGGTLALLDPMTLQPIGEPINVDGPRASSVAVHPSGQRLAVGGPDGTVTMWDLATRRPLSTIALHSAPVYQVQFSGDGSLLASASVDGTARLSDVATGEPLGEPFPKPVTAHVGFTTDGRLLAVGSANGVIAYTLDPHHWVRIACAVAGRNLTRAEWDDHLGTTELEWRATCPDHPLPE